MNYVKSCSDPSDLKSIAQTVFKSSSCSVEEGLAKLKQSIDYIQSSSTQSQPDTPNGEPHFRKCATQNLFAVASFAVIICSGNILFCKLLLAGTGDDAKVYW